MLSFTSNVIQLLNVPHVRGIHCGSSDLVILVFKKRINRGGSRISGKGPSYGSTTDINSEYDQEIPQSQTADNPMAL